MAYQVRNIFQGQPAYYYGEGALRRFGLDQANTNPVATKAGGQTTIPGTNTSPTSSARPTTMGGPTPGMASGRAGAVVGRDANGNPLVVGSNGKPQVSYGHTVEQVTNAIAHPSGPGDLAQYSNDQGVTSEDPRSSQIQQPPMRESQRASIGAQDTLIAQGRVPRAWSDGVAIFDDGGVIPEPVEGVGQVTGRRYRFGGRGPERVISNDGTSNDSFGDLQYQSGHTFDQMQSEQERMAQEQALMGRRLIPQHPTGAYMQRTRTNENGPESKNTARAVNAPVLRVTPEQVREMANNPRLHDFLKVLIQAEQRGGVAVDTGDGNQGNGVGFGQGGRFGSRPDFSQNSGQDNGNGNPNPPGPPLDTGNQPGSSIDPSTAQDFAPLSGSPQQTAQDFAPLSGSPQQTAQDFQPELQPMQRNEPAPSGYTAETSPYTPPYAPPQPVQIPTGGNTSPAVDPGISNPPTYSPIMNVASPSDIAPSSTFMPDTNTPLPDWATTNQSTLADIYGGARPTADQRGGFLSDAPTDYSATNFGDITTPPPDETEAQAAARLMSDSTYLTA